VLCLATRVGGAAFVEEGSGGMGWGHLAAPGLDQVSGWGPLVGVRKWICLEEVKLPAPLVSTGPRGLSGIEPYSISCSMVQVQLVLKNILELSYNDCFSLLIAFLNPGVKLRGEKVTLLSVLTKIFPVLLCI
jgi:hypothetical protein